MLCLLLLLKDATLIYMMMPIAPAMLRFFAPYITLLAYFAMLFAYYFVSCQRHATYMARIYERHDIGATLLELRG